MLLHRFSQSEASDSRDFIYALLGISSDACNTDVLVPDYSKSEEEVVQSTVAFLVDAHHCGVPIDRLPQWPMVEFWHNLQCLRMTLLPWTLEEVLGSMAGVLLTNNRESRPWWIPRHFH